MPKILILRSKVQLRSNSTQIRMVQRAGKVATARLSQQVEPLPMQIRVCLYSYLSTACSIWPVFASRQPRIGPRNTQVRGLYTRCTVRTRFGLRMGFYLRGSMTHSDPKKKKTHNSSCLILTKFAMIWGHPNHIPVKHTQHEGGLLCKARAMGGK